MACLTNLLASCPVSGPSVYLTASGSEVYACTARQSEVRNSLISSLLVLIGEIPTSETAVSFGLV